MLICIHNLFLQPLKHGYNLDTQLPRPTMHLSFHGKTGKLLALENTNYDVVDLLFPLNITYAFVKIRNIYLI